MHILGLLKKTQKKKTSSLDLRKTQSSPVIIIRNTPTNLKPILTNHSNFSNEPQQRKVTVKEPARVTVKEPARIEEPARVEQNDRQQALADRLCEITADDMELLLSLETQARMDHQAELQDHQVQQENHAKRLKFALPPPKRWSLPEDAIRQDLKKKPKRKPHPELRYGAKVQLIRSPLKTTAFVRYMGPVHFAPGEWIGVELERAVGKTDGSVDGHRYFYTGAYRGSFFTKDELILA